MIFNIFKIKNNKKKLGELKNYANFMCLSLAREWGDDREQDLLPYWRWARRIITFQYIWSSDVCQVPTRPTRVVHAPNQVKNRVTSSGLNVATAAETG